MTMFKRLMPGLVCVALLSACASSGKGSGAPQKPQTVAEAAAAAETAAKAGERDKALAILKEAGSAFPTDGTPWQRMAQMHFDDSNYGEAITHAQEALERDPADMLSSSIAIVSGLRVASKSLQDLTSKNNVKGDLRTEAQELTKLLREALGEEELVGGNRNGNQRKEASAKTRTASKQSQQPSGRRTAAKDDPFSILK